MIGQYFLPHNRPLSPKRSLAVIICESPIYSLPIFGTLQVRLLRVSEYLKYPDTLSDNKLLCLSIKGGDMPIKEKDVVIGGKYRTPNNQERVVVGCNENCQVVYASRGGNVQNEFDHREESSLEGFAEACSEKIGTLTDAQLTEVIEKCSAQNTIGGGECCLSKT